MATLITYAQLYKKQEDGSYVPMGWEEQGRFEIEDEKLFNRLLKKAQSWRLQSIPIERYHVIGHKGSGVYEHVYIQGTTTWETDENGGMRSYKHTRGRTGWQKVA